MAEWTWAKSKDFITKLQEAPEPPIVVPIVPYPEEEGTHNGSRYYSTAISQSIINSLLENYLSFLNESKEAILLGRGNKEVEDLALSITGSEPTTYGKAKAIHRWVYENVSYTKTKYIIPPWELIKPDVAGDCKSFSILTASLLGIANIPCWLKLVKISSVPDLHIYDQANLTWAIVDAVGSLFNREVKPVSGYVLYEIDRTTIWPPRVLPSGAEITIPEELKKILPLVGITAVAIGTVALIWQLVKR